jgi:UDP-N-acetylglucosamine--N-acetylmuramyl-(pentapeptide) pyrophosphoryl-undecaprenol N-acetylglucosamine transferase
MALVNKQAAVLVKDKDAQTQLISTALDLLKDTEQLKQLKQNILKLALPDSAKLIAEEVMRLAQKK